jgi:hypothetical protein
MNRPNGTPNGFFLNLRDEATVWCHEHEAPVTSWTPGPSFADRAAALDFIAASREWYSGPNAPTHCLFRHDEPVAA